MPKRGCLPQISHTDAMTKLLSRWPDERMRLAAGGAGSRAGPGVRSRAMSVRTAVDGEGLAQLVEEYREVLRSHQEELNRLNVYPVPDGDTGTNMALTLESVCAEVGMASDTVPHAMASVCQAIAHGSLMGARGHSAVILSQIRRGLTDTFRGADEVGAAELTRGLRASADAATSAVMHPVEGTILTVVGDAARAAEGCAAGSTLVDVLDAVAAEAHASVER